MSARRAVSAPARHTALRLRELRPDERWVVREVFSGLSPESRLRRYHAPLHRLSDAMVARLAAVDGSAHVAVAAEARGHDGWHPAGIARLVRIAPGEAELAVEVVDRWQGRGVGRMLLEDLRQRAAGLGYVSVTGSILVGNVPMLELLRSVFPGAVVRQDGRTWEVTAPVPPLQRRTRRRPRRRPPGRPRDLGRRRPGRGHPLPMAAIGARAKVVPPQHPNENPRERRNDR